MNEKKLDVNGISLKCLTSVEEFKGLKKEWNELLAKSKCFPVCLQWEWMDLWWKHFSQDDYQLVLLTFRKEKKLVGIFPLVCMKKKVKFCISINRLVFMGTGENEEEEVTSEFLDIISEPGYEDEICSLSVDFLLNEYVKWDVIELCHQLDNSVLAVQFLNELSNSKFLYQKSIIGYRRYIRLEKKYDEYVEKRSKSFRKNLRNYTNRLNKLGEVKKEFITQYDQLDYFFKSLIELHTSRFDGLPVESSYNSSRFTGFHKDYLKVALEKKQLDLMLLTVDGEVVSIEYNYKLGDIVHAYSGGFVSAYKKISLGFLSINMMIEKAIDDNRAVFDFMAGDRDSYVSTYGCECEPLLGLRVFNKKHICSTMYRLLMFKSRIKTTLDFFKKYK
jgi:hypothetical protein